MTRLGDTLLRFRPLQVVIVLALLLNSTSTAALGGPSLATPHLTGSAYESNITTIAKSVTAADEASVENIIPQAQASNVELVGQIGGLSYAVAVQGVNDRPILIQV